MLLVALEVGACSNIQRVLGCKMIESLREGAELVIGALDFAPTAVVTATEAGLPISSFVGMRSSFSAEKTLSLALAQHACKGELISLARLEGCANRGVQTHAGNASGL